MVEIYLGEEKGLGKKMVERPTTKLVLIQICWVFRCKSVVLREEHLSIGVEIFTK